MYGERHTRTSYVPYILAYVVCSLSLVCCPESDAHDQSLTTAQPSVGPAELQTVFDPKGPMGPFEILRPQ
eukprot:COSAG01_NODE_33614_length_561_cov_1.341991_1_plen_69_part_10